jgi:hypothetical protein
MEIEKPTSQYPSPGCFAEPGVSREKQDEKIAPKVSNNRGSYTQKNIGTLFVFQSDINDSRIEIIVEAFQFKRHTNFHFTLI